MEVVGKVTHFVGSDNNINFSFSKFDEKNSKENNEEVYTSYSYSLLFEIWKKFKNQKIKITIDKVE